MEWKGCEKQEHSSRSVSHWGFSPSQTQVLLHLVTKTLSAFSFILFSLSAFLSLNLLAPSYQHSGFLLFLKPPHPQDDHMIWPRLHDLRLAKEKTAFAQTQKSVWGQACDCSPNRILPRILLEQWRQNQPDPTSQEFQGPLMSSIPTQEKYVWSE